ncbi:MFS transporter [Streptomyces capparidis]
MTAPHKSLGTPVRPPAAPGAPGGRTRAALTLATVLLGYLLVPMAMSGTSLALPRIAADLGGGAAALQWVITGYFLAASCLMLVAGSLGDLFGRRRVFLGGATLYVLSTAGAAAAPSVALLDVARTLSGAGAAGVMAGGGAILGAAFHGPARTRAFAAVGTVVGVGLAFGPTLSGWLVGALGWRAMFAVFAAVGVPLVLGALRVADPAPVRGGRIDVPGIAALVVGMSCLMFGATRVADSGWTSPGVLGPAAVGVLALAALVAVERRSDHPVLDLSLLRAGPFRGWLLAALAIAAGSVGVLVHLPAYLQGAGARSAGDAGSVMLAMTLPVLAVPPLAGRLVARGVPAARLIVLGVALVAAGNAWLTVLAPGSGLPHLLGPLALIGTGSGVAAALIDAQAMEHVAPDRVGMASGLLNTVRSGGNTLVLALFGAALAGLVQSRVGDREVAGRVAAGDLGDGPHALLAEHYTAAWHTVSWVAAALCAASAVAVHRLVTRPARRPVGE